MNGAKNLCIRYRKDHQHQQYNRLGLFGAVDADLAGDKDGARLTTGYVIFLAGGPVLWRSRLQDCVAKHSTEAEYVALSEAAGELIWVRQLLEELHVMPKGPITLLEDNTGAEKWVTETAVTKKKRHIRIHYHFIRDEVFAGRI